MKKWGKVVLFVAFILLAAGCAGSSPYMRQSSPPGDNPPADKARVYFMRPSGFGFAVHFQIWDRENLIGLAQAKSYFVYECDPGKHLFIGIAENKRAVEADLKAGKSYYILTQVKMGGWKARMGFIPVRRNSEYWDQVERYRRDLLFTSPDRAQLERWLAANGSKATAVIRHTIQFLETPEGRKYVEYLGEGDGR
ncbi:MAG: hypothetical protein JRJ01_08735 [Deltaproteobacteria bacterium]|nr:hypothetical protein [Deltaproteobacteria bacterium]